MTTTTTSPNSSLSKITLLVITFILVVVCSNWIMHAAFFSQLFHLPSSSSSSSSSSSACNGKNRHKTVTAGGASEDLSPPVRFTKDDDFPIKPLQHLPDRTDLEPIKEPHCSRPIRVFDVVSFFNEIDLYEVRVAELFEVVNLFVTVEANTTFQGKPKAVFFQKLKHQLPEKFQHKLHNYFCGELEGKTNWDRERSHRKCMQDAVAHFHAKRHDLIIFGDADEIPSGEDIGVAKKFVNTALCRPHRNHFRTDLFRMFPLAFRMTVFFYNFRWISRPLKWTTDLHMFDGFNVRNLKRGLVLGRESEESSDQIYFGKGWHCSWCFSSLSKFRNKFDSYSHSEFKSEKGYSAEHLHSVVCQGEEIFKYAGKYASGNTHNVSMLTAEAALENAPKYLRENLWKFPYLLPTRNPPCLIRND